MPTWGDILIELRGSKAPQGTGPDFDGVRRRYLRALHERTGRAVILYSTAYLESRLMPASALQIGREDVQGFMEAVSNVEERKLDLILHSPGGSADAAESIVDYLRQRFCDIRIFVPLAAMSAATMVALSANEIVMGQHSQLGPIDPQFIITTPEGPRSAPAKAILNQFELAKQECRDPSNLAAWMPILRSYAPGLLTQCIDARQLAESMVSAWLRTYMFAGDTDAHEKADRIAKWFADYDSFQSHGRRVGLQQASEIGLKVTALEKDNDLQDAVLSIHHAAMHTFSGTGSLKIIENHLGRAWFAALRGTVVGPASPPSSPADAPPNVPVPPLGPNRADRRRSTRKRR